MKVEKIVLIWALLASCQINGQTIDYSIIHAKADSIVKSFWGLSNFNKYIRLDKTKSEYTVFKNHWDKAVSINEIPEFIPNIYSYKYTINHPLFDSLDYPINFLLDSLGNLMIGMSPKGLVKFENLDAIKTISKDSAILIAKKSGISIYKRPLEIELVWSNPITNLGCFVWEVRSYYDKPRYEGCFRYEYQAFLIDIKTGKVMGKMK
jgi:hypothetical protein